MIELFYYPQAFYLLPCVLLEFGGDEETAPEDPIDPGDHTCLTLAWFIWTLEITV